MRFLHRADLNCAVAMGTAPVFPFFDNRSNCSPGLGATTSERARASSMHLSGPAISTATNVETLNKELKTNFNNLKRLGEMNAHNKESSNLTKEDRIRDSDTLYLTERSLLTLSNIWGPRKFVTSACLTAIIYIDNQLRGVGFRASIMDRLVERLQLSVGMVLEDISQQDIQEKAARAILWALFVGAIAAIDRPCRGWFLERLLDFSDVLNLRTWNETENILKGFLWPPAWETQGRALWNEVEENRLMKYTTFSGTSNGEEPWIERDTMDWY